MKGRIKQRAGFCLIALLLLLVPTSPLLAAESNHAAEVAKNLFHWRPFLAPFHAVVLHFPIGFLTMAFILEVYRIRRPSDELKRVTVLVVWLSLISGIIAAAFGTMRAGSGGYELRMLSLHRWFGMAVPILTLATLGVQRFAYRAAERGNWEFAYRTLLGGTLALLLVAGHYGGNLTHGSKYLTENAPAFVRELLENDRPAVDPEAKGEEQAGEQPWALYTQKIEPVFTAKCFQCHGPEKQKGDYRLDHPSTALKGGESGDVAIVPGDPFASKLVRLILLPRSHDEAMPPEGKQPLTPEEIIAVINWIQQGARFPDDLMDSLATNSVAIPSAPASH